MSRQFTKIPAHKPPPRKKLVRPMQRMSARIKGLSSFKPMGGK